MDCCLERIFIPLFDLGLIAVSPLNFTVLLHPKLGESSYSELSGRMIALPENADDRPDVDALSDHGCWAGLFNRRPGVIPLSSVVEKLR